MDNREAEENIDVKKQNKTLKEKHDEKTHTTSENYAAGESAIPVLSTAEGYICRECGLTYSRKDTLKNHQKKKHNIDTQTLKRSQCSFPGCKETFFHKSKLIEHQKNYHVTNIKEVNLQFKSIDEFFNWKENEELENYVYFSKQTGDVKSQLNNNKYYVCQFDGNAEAHRSKDEPSRKTSRVNRCGKAKTNLFCPARVTVHVDNITKQVHVNYIKTHSHPITIRNTQHHPVPHSVREKLKGQLSVGMTAQEVYRGLREGLGNRDSRDEEEKLTKIHLITKSNITSIGRHIRYSRRLHPKDSVSTFFKVQKLRDEKYNCVLVYKPQGFTSNLTHKK